MNTRTLAVPGAPSLLSRFRRTAALLVLTSASLARADVLVLIEGGSRGPGFVASVDAGSGLVRQEFGRDNEGLHHLSVSAAAETFVSANVLGDSAIYAFDREGRFRAIVAPWKAGADYGNVEIGPDGGWFTTWFDAASGHRKIARLSAGALSAFAEPTNAVLSPELLAFGPDGLLYASDPDAGIVRLNPRTGVFLDVFVPLGRGGLEDVRRMRFGPDGRLYVASRQANAVLRFGARGEFLDVFVTPGAAGVNDPSGLAFGPDGSLYVASRGTRQVLRFDGETGAFQRAVITLPAPQVPADLGYVPDPAPALDLPSPAASGPGGAER